jgi:hypothetical protein
VSASHEEARVSGDDLRWLLLIHQIPPKPDYLRVKIGRRLQKVGAVPVKNSVYVLPDHGQSFEDFQWIRTEIIDGGGDASICRADFVDGLTNDQIRHLFRSARDAEYAEIATAARELWASLRGRERDARESARSRASRPEDELARLRKRLAGVAAIDFFDAPERAMAEEALGIVDAELEPRRPAAERVGPLTADRSAYHGRTWVTRADIFVDRIASAWLIRRFIDPDARFKFVPGDAYQPGKGELRFDMFEGELTHEGDRCTFEVLIERFALDAPGLRALAEVVHDIDLKDGKFARADAAGIERVLLGLVAAHPDDAARLERGSQLFDEMFALAATEAKARG